MESVCVYLRIASIDSAFQIMTVRSAPPDANLVPENKYMNVNIHNSRKSTQHINHYHVLNYLHTLVSPYTKDTTDIHVHVHMYVKYMYCLVCLYLVDQLHVILDFCYLQ